MIEEEQGRGKTIDVQFDLKALEYYEYLRSIIQTNEISYWIGNPSVSIINGSISLAPLTLPTDHHQTFTQYIQSIKLSNKPPLPHSSNQPHSNHDVGCKQSTKGKYKLRSEYLLFCGIPNNKTPIQIIENHLMKAYRGGIIEMRVIKTIQLKYYGILMRFKNKEISTRFYNELFGVEYNEIEIEKIILREMLQITLLFSEISKDGETNQYKIMRKLSEDGGLQKMTPDIIFVSNHHIKNKFVQLHLEENVSQKLTCTICFEQVNLEIISILCGHYFHSSCLERWQSNTCPLCRYHQQPPVISFCEKCNQCQGLWVCLICGIRLCCGSANDILSQDSHIYQHFLEFNHSLSMELQTKFIFDAKVPAFLHQMFYRDLMKKGSSKEIKEQRIKEQNMQKQGLKKNKLSDKISMYENQVSQEMQKQRIYFEQNLSKKIKAHRQEVYKLKEKYKTLQAHDSILGKELGNIEKQSGQIDEEIERAQKQQKIIGNLTKMLLEKVNKWRQQNDGASRLQSKRLMELQQLIKQKRNELINYNSNLRVQERLRAKLKGQNIEQQMFLMGDRKGKRKK